ncbi:MAG: hypothetical protein PF503_09365 [Desulfobacula sp.]|nr:hypothetical protein [Desulfobacula sp.]
MALILNILWFVFGGGLLAWILWVLLGCLLCTPGEETCTKINCKSV